MSEKVIIELSKEAAHELEKIISYGGYSLDNIKDLEFEKFHSTAKGSYEDELKANADKKTSEEIGKFIGRVRPKLEAVGVVLPKDATVNTIVEKITETLKSATADKEDYAKQRVLDMETELNTTKALLVGYETKETLNLKRKGFESLLPKDVKLNEMQLKALMGVLESEADVKVLKDKEAITFVEKGTDKPYKVNGKVMKDSEIVNHFFEQLIPKTNTPPTTETKEIPIEKPVDTFQNIRETLSLTPDSTMPK